MARYASCYNNQSFGCIKPLTVLSDSILKSQVATKWLSCFRFTAGLLALGSIKIELV